MEAENNTRTIKAAVQPAIRIRHPKKTTGLLGGNPSTKMSVLGSSFKYEESNYMVAGAMEEHALASSEEAYEYPGGHAPMGFTAIGGGFHDVNDSHWWDQKHPSFTSHNCSENTNWETDAVKTSVAEEAIRKATDRVNALLECWGCNNTPRYHADRLHTYRNCPNKMEPDVADCAKRSLQDYTQRN